jgi:choline dehydrogenase
MYDYIVVGAGSAGCVVASRLSEDPDVSILLIEAGGDNREEHMSVPAMFGQLFKTSHDWDYESEPEPNLGGRRNYLPRGKGLGGTSALNGMVYIRGHRDDFDGWRDLGNPGWGYEDVLPYFIKAEDNVRGASAYHGVGGPLSVSDPRYEHPISRAWLESALNAGFEANPDFNGPEQDGVGFYQVTQREASRWSTATAYLYPVLERPNVEVRTHTFVNRVLIEDSRAVGVELEHLSEVSEVRASREVILSGGVYNSPQALMLSGIGPRAQLTGFGIDCLVDLPVGEGLQDHAGIFLQYATDTETMRTVGTPENLELWREKREGPLTSNVVEVGGFFRSRPDLPRPDVQTTIMPIGWAEEGLAEVKDDQFMILQWLLRPKTTGSVRLRSATPTAKPRIVNNHLDHEQDMRSMIDGLRLQLKIAEQEPLRSHERAVLQAPPSSGSDSEFEQYLRDGVLSCYHATSSCRMGEVVDSELKVHGVEGLRVADASVMPFMVNGNPNAATIMIGEKAADLIKGVKGAERASDGAAAPTRTA